MAGVFDPSDMLLAANILDRIAPAASSTTDIWMKCWADASYQSLPATIKLEFDILFGVELRENFSSAGAVELYEHNIGPIATRPFDETPEHVWLFREKLLSTVSNDMVRAHLSDLILTGKRNRTPEHAETTIANYIACATNNALDHGFRAISLGRANTIARKRSLSLEDSIRSQAMELSKEFLYSKQIHAALTMLALLSAPSKHDPNHYEERQEVWDSLINILVQSPEFLDESIRLLQLIAKNKAEKDEVARLHISWYLDAARNETNGIRKLSFSQEAINLAKKYEQKDLKDEATVLLQQAGNEVELQTFDHTVTLPRNHFRHHLQKFRRVKDWKHAYQIFLAGPSPSGNYENNLKTANTSKRGIFSLVNTINLGPNNLPTRTDPSTDDEDVRRIEKMNVLSVSTLLALELDHIKENFKIPNVEEFTNWFSGIFACDPVLAKQLASAQKRYWDEDYTGSAQICLPLIEAGLRGLLLKLNEPLYRTERGMSPGHFPAMDFYVKALEQNRLDIDWVRAIRIILLSDGLNIRNQTAHGFKFEFKQSESALLLRLAGFACVLSGAIDHTELSSPLSVPQASLRRRIGWIWY